jgi:hypothetical protein
MKSRVWILALIVLLCWSVIATISAVYFYQQYTSIGASMIQVSVTIDYGNGTSITHEKVRLFYNTTALDALMAVAKVSATYWPSFDATFVDAINGVANNPDDMNYWMYYVNGEHAAVGADKYLLHNGDHVEWKYEHM